jgi:hypothetical protein
MKGIMRRFEFYIWEKKKLLGILEEIAKQIDRIRLIFISCI